MLSQVVADLKNAFWPRAPQFSRELLSPAELMRARERRPALSDYLPYCAYIEDEQIFVNQDSLGFCIELQPQGGANEDTAQILTALFSDSRVGAGIQFHLLASPHIQHLLRSYANLRVPDAIGGDGRRLGRAERQSNLYRTMARARAGFLMQGARHPLIPGQLLRDFRLVVSATLPGHVDDLSRREELIRMREAMRTTFKAADFGSWTWDASALINWTSNLLNPQRIFNSGATAYYDDGRDLAAQIVDHDTVVRVTEQGLHFGKPASSEAIEARFLSVKHFPPHFGLWSMGTLIGDLFQSTLQYPCPFMITLGVHVLDPVATRNWASMKGTRAATNDKSVMARFQPEYHDQNDDWVMTLKALAEGQNLVDLYHEVALFAPPADITRAEESARAIWRSRGFELTNDTFVNTQALLASLPMTLSTRLYADLKKLKRVTTKTTTNAVHLAPLLGEWRGTDTPVLLLAGRRGQMIKLDVFDNNSGNYNVAIAGTSGSGKSVFLNEIAVSYLGCGAKVWIIDVGRSYEKTCRNFNGTFIEFTENNPISLNPFSSVVDINEDMAMLQPALVRMASPQEKLDNYLNACLGTAIKIAWNAKGRDMTVTDVHDLLASGRLDDQAAEPDRRLKDLAAMLRPYTRDGVYGRFFDGPATIDFSNDFVVLELEELKAKKDLQAVVLLIVMHRITQEMYFTRDRKKLLVIDEAWDLLGGDATAKFIETAYRRVRKYDGSVMSASQALDDYLKNDASMAALTNSDWLFFLRQRKESVEKLGELKRLAADEGMKRTLQSLRTEHGAYSEIFVSGPGGNGIGRLIVDPYSLLLYSSKAEDVSAIDAKRAQGLSLPEAIEAVLAERGPR